MLIPELILRKLLRNYVIIKRKVDFSEEISRELLIANANHFLFLNEDEVEYINSLIKGIDLNNNLNNNEKE